MKYQLITKEMVDGLGNKAQVSGITQISSYSVATTKTDSKYYNGVLKAVGSVPFKVWSGALFDQLEAEDYTGSYVYVEAEVNIWNDSRSLVLKSAVAVDPTELGVSVEELDPTPYDISANEKEFYAIMREELSPSAFQLFKKIYTRIRPQFRQEYAAVSIHDAYRGGLLAHTLKMLKILRTTWSLYSTFDENINKDLVFLGLAIHDMGKTVEYDMGTPSAINYATHNFLGQEILFEFKKDILEGFEFTEKGVEGTKHVEPLGVDFYYRLQAIIQQHHGEFGEPCHTVESYIVHLVDMYESRLEMLHEKLPFTGRLSLEFGKYKVQ